MQSALNREYRKMYRNLNGIRTMNRLPECLVVVDPKKEKNAVQEARKLGLTTVSLIDTDCDPDQVDLPIPGNDDGIRSIELIIRHLADAVLAGKAALPTRRDASEAPAAVADKDSNEARGGYRTAVVSARLANTPTASQPLEAAACQMQLNFPPFRAAHSSPQATQILIQEISVWLLSVRLK